MADDMQIIKSYLVQLGFETDNQSLGEMAATVSMAGKMVSGLVESMSDSLGTIPTAFATMTASVGGSVAGLLDSLANQNVQMQILSRQFWTSEQNAMAFSESLKILHANVQDLYLSPTLLQQYQQLFTLGQKLQTPGDYSNEIKQIQDIQLQFRELQMEGYYALQWIGYYFIKYLQGPLGNIQTDMQKLNDSIVKNMPTWTKQVAQWLVAFVQGGEEVIQALGNVWSYMKSLLSYIPGWAKAVAAAFGLITLDNPFALFIGGLSAAVLMIQDFETYLKDPSKSAFPQFWAWVIKIDDALKQMDIGKTVANDIKVAFEELGKEFEDTAQFAEKLYAVFKDNGTLNTFKQGIVSVYDASNNLGKSIGQLVISIGDLFGKLNNSQNQSGLVNFFQLIANVANTAIQAVSGAIDVVSYLADAVSDILNGNWKAAANMINLIDGAGGNPFTQSSSASSSSPSSGKVSVAPIPLSSTKAASLLNGRYSIAQGFHPGSSTQGSVTNIYNQQQVNAPNNVKITSTASSESLSKSISKTHVNHVRQIGAAIQGG